MPTPSAPNPPKQLRSRRTLDRIVRAALEILEQEGAGALTVHAIVARAGSSVGSFYARFSGKEELLAYLGERVWREAAARWDEAVAARVAGGLALPELVRGAVLLLAEAARARGTYLRELRGASGSGDEAYEAFQAHVLHGIEGLLLARADEMGHPSPAVGVRLGLRAVLAVLEQGRREPEQGPISMETRVDEATRLLLTYLGGGPAEGDAAEQVDFFDIWG